MIVHGHGHLGFKVMKEAVLDLDLPNYAQTTANVTSVIG